MFNKSIKIFGDEPYSKWGKCKIFLSIVSSFGTHNLLIGDTCFVPNLNRDDIINISITSSNNQYPIKEWKKNLINKLDLEFKYFKENY